MVQNPPVGSPRLIPMLAYADDVDAHFERARAAGATITATRSLTLPLQPTAAGRRRLIP